MTVHENARPARPARPGRPRRRQVVGTLVGTGALALSLVPALGSTSVAAVPRVSAAESATLLAAPEAPPRGRAWIEGQVVNQAGRPLDGIVVEAYRYGDDASMSRRADAAPVASWITYADPDVDGPAHGFFRLYVPRNGPGDGLFVLKASSLPDARDPYTPQLLDDEVVYVGGGQRGIVEDFGEIEMSLARRADSFVDLTASPSTKRSDKQGRLSVSVTSPDVSTITGKLRLAIDGRSRGTRTLTRSDRGRTALALPRLRPGRHVITVDYLGSSDVLAASAVERVKVEAPRHHGRGGRGGHR